MKPNAERALHAAMFSLVIATSGFLIVAGVVGDMPGAPYVSAFIEQFTHAFLLTLVVVAIIRATEASGLQGWRRAALQAMGLAAGVAAAAIAISELAFLHPFILTTGVAGTRALLVQFLWMGLAASVLFSWYYASRERALRSIRALSAASIARYATLTRAEEARLRALRAEVAPQFLDDALLRIQEAYGTAAESGDRALDELIEHLSRALLASRSESSQPAREVPCPTVP